MTSEIRNSLKQVLAQLQLVELELNRPNEDVVTLTVCLGARRSISELMHIYLISNSIDNNETKSLDALLNECIKLDNEFSSVDVSKIVCKEMNTTECDGKYCLDIKNVSDCFVVANKLKTIVLNKLMITESELED